MVGRERAVLIIHAEERRPRVGGGEGEGPVRWECGMGDELVAAISDPTNPSLQVQDWARVVTRLRELAPRVQRESGGGIHATWGPLFCPALY